MSELGATLPSPTERKAMIELAQSLVAQAKELQSYIEKYGDCDRIRETHSIVPDISSIAPSPADKFLDTDDRDRDTLSPSANSTLNLIRNMHNMPSPFETYSESQYCLDAAIICEITAKLKGDATGLHKIVSLVLHNDDVHEACEILLECTEGKACKLLSQAQSVLGQAHHAASDPVSFSRFLIRFRHAPLEGPGDSEGEKDTEDHQLPSSYTFDMDDFDYLERGSFDSPRSPKMTSLLAMYPDDKLLQYIVVPVFCHCKLFFLLWSILILGTIWCGIVLDHICEVPGLVIILVLELGPILMCLYMFYLGNKPHKPRIHI